VRVLVIGYGSMGKRHARNARELGHEVTILDLSNNAEAQAMADGFQILIGSAVHHDAIVIASPAATHYQLASGLAERGYAGPLFVEKPLDITTEHAEFWRSWPHPTTCVGYNWRFHQAARFFFEQRDDYLQRADDRYSRVHLCCCTNMDEWPGTRYSSPLLECSHEVDLLGRLRGDLESARAQRDGMLLRFEHATVTVYWDCSDGCRVFTELRGNDVKVEVTIPSYGPMLEKSYREELRRFLHAAERGAKCSASGLATFEDGLAVIEICEQVGRMCEVEA